MLKVFLDANVLIAGAASPSGGSRQILDWAEQKLIRVCVSRQVLDEARGNIAKKLPRAILVFERIIKAIKPHVARQPSQMAINRAAKVIDVKDAPILAAAVTAKIDYFVTLDRKHFKVSSVERYVFFPILLPAEFVMKLRPRLEPK